MEILFQIWGKKRNIIKSCLPPNFKPFMDKWCIYFAFVLKYKRKIREEILVSDITLGKKYFSPCWISTCAHQSNIYPYVCPFICMLVCPSIRHRQLICQFHFAHQGCIGTPLPMILSCQEVWYSCFDTLNVKICSLLQILFTEEVGCKNSCKTEQRSTSGV